MTGIQGRQEIIVKDLSVIELSHNDEKLWMQDLCFNLEKEKLTFRLTDKNIDEDPVVEFRHGRWFAGRYVGEITFKGRTLRILPRYESSFYRWISKIWGVRMIQSGGSYRQSNIWLWELIARVWGEQLILGAKHGLPYTRIEESFQGPSLRGRMKVMETALEVGKGTNILVSQTRVKVIHPIIAVVLSKAYRKIKKELGNREDRRWLSDRGREIIGLLQQTSSNNVSNLSSGQTISKIRYTPILESYRAVVELSLRLLQQKSIGASSFGSKEITGALLDMAEIWELYVYHLLHQIALSGVEVIHTGREKFASGYLFQSAGRRKLGALKPDVILRTPVSKQVLAVVDAKYKHTFSSLTKPTGLERNDLYQIHAYMDAFASPGHAISGILVYPDEAEAQIRKHQAENPWNSSHLNSSLCFFGINGEFTAEEQCSGLTSSEERFCNEIREIIRSNVRTELT